MTSTGAFLIPYFTCLIIAGIAILILELGIGQYMQSGGITVWNLVPLFRGKSDILFKIN